MKKNVMIIVVVVALALSGVNSVSADSDNAAIVVNLDGGCWWFGGGHSAVGRLDYVETQNGHWKLSCHADSFTGPAISEALVFHSSPDAPLGTCTTAAGVTNKFHIVFTPSGQTSFVCQGD